LEKYEQQCAPMSREKFIDCLVDGLCTDQRFKRREAFAVKWWATLKHEYPKAPELEDEAAWTLDTLITIPRTTLYELINEGVLRTAHLKRKDNKTGIRLIQIASLDEYIAKQTSGGRSAPTKKKTQD
jgi:hypothetical protein